MGLDKADWFDGFGELHDCLLLFERFEFSLYLV